MNRLMLTRRSDFLCIWLSKAMTNSPPASSIAPSIHAIRLILPAMAISFVQVFRPARIGRKAAPDTRTGSAWGPCTDSNQFESGESSQKRTAGEDHGHADQIQILREQ